MEHHTYNTLCHFKKIYPNDEIYYIIGDDDLIWLQDWTYYEKIISNFKCVVVNRTRTMEENLKIINNCSAYMHYKNNFIVIDNNRNDVSATMIRTLLKNKDYEKAKKYIYPSVLDYIKDNKLYGGNRNESYK